MDQTRNQSHKGDLFRRLHHTETCFVIPNPWDVGTARLAAAAGFAALATTSAGYAFALGQADGTVTRERMLEHCREIVLATELPVSADLENGYADTPEEVAETISLAAQAGLVGASIEDATGRPDVPIYDFDLAVERVRAAAQAASALPLTFTLTARAENFLHRRPDLDDTIRRLQAFEAAGADVLYAPGIRTKQQILAVVEALSKPVNLLIGITGMRFSLEDLGAMGVKRASLGSGLSRLALGAFVRSLHELRETGTVEFMSEAIPFAELERQLQLGEPSGG